MSEHVTDNALAMAGIVTLLRDVARKTRPLLGCEHEFTELPIVDFCVDEWCRKCNGVRSTVPGAGA